MPALRWIAYAKISIGLLCAAIGLFEGPLILMVGGVSTAIFGVFLLAASEAVDTLKDISKTLKERLPAAQPQEDFESVSVAGDDGGEVASLEELQSRIDQLKS